MLGSIVFAPHFTSPDLNKQANQGTLLLQLCGRYSSSNFGLQYVCFKNQTADLNTPKTNELGTYSGRLFHFEQLSV